MTNAVLRETISSSLTILEEEVELAINSLAQFQDMAEKNGMTADITLEMMLRGLDLTLSLVQFHLQFTRDKFSELGDEEPSPSPPKRHGGYKPADDDASGQGGKS